MSSLRNKIVSTYGYSKLVMLAFATVVFVDLHYLDRQIQAGQAVTDFREAVLEMRRDEKNLFLYREPSSLEQLLLQAEAARSAIRDGRDAFVTIVGETEVVRLERVLETYRDKLAGYLALNAASTPVAQEGIRKLGHELGAASNEMSRRERQSLAEATRRAGLTLMLTFAGVVALGVAGGFFLVRRVMRPLRRLENGLIDIDEGRARELPLPSTDKEIVSFVAAFNAMLKHMRQQQNQVKRNEKAAALGVLVSGVAHELNNPLSNISTSAQLLLEEGEAVDAMMRQAWLTQIDSETERARRIVRRLLDSVRQPKLHPQWLTLTELIESSLALVSRQLPPQVLVTMDHADDASIAVDRERLHQVFINLIKNAADAGARHIRIEGHLASWSDSVAEAGHLEGDPALLSIAPGAARITVTDDGPGIAPEVREHIFDPFFTTRAAGDGTGLGLYLVEEIVSEHRGCIVVDNPPEGGTRFSIWLPLTAEETP